MPVADVSRHDRPFSYVYLRLLNLHGDEGCVKEKMEITTKKLMEQIDGRSAKCMS